MNSKLKKEFFKKLSKKTILEDIISKFKSITLNEIIINCKVNLSFGEIRIFLSEKKPIKKIDTNKKFKIRLLGFIKIVGTIKKIPPVSGILLSLVVKNHHQHQL